MNYFTSDTHFGHENVIRYCDRPFCNVQEMNLVMLSNIQQSLTDEDDLYFLGDWSMNSKYYCLIRNIPFRHLYFVLGNHDRAKKLRYQLEIDKLSNRVTILNDRIIEIAGKHFYLTHRPIQASDNMPTLCGHVHEKWTIQKSGSEIREFKRDGEVQIKHLTQSVLNVGVDCHEFFPLSEADIMDYRL